ncbi:MAG: formate C-acetyltransferase [Bdellovibrio sp.]|nr:MAG: formate C-acetyltransferase [Bdellovibrio sp.]
METATMETAISNAKNNDWVPERWQPGRWNTEINVRDFIQKNYQPYEGDGQFLAPPTDRTETLWRKVLELMREERRKGILDSDTEIISSITSHAPGFIDRDAEIILGLQTDKPLKRAIVAYGGVRMAEQALEAHGYKLEPKLAQFFKQHRRTHNDGVFAAYTPEMVKARRSGIITGLPDAYGRGRIIGDYRRVALYGVDRLIEKKKADLDQLNNVEMNEEAIRLREEISEQIKALGELKQMGAGYGFDLGRPAANAHEAVQWVYLAYLAAVKEQNGAAMSLGRVSTFLDIFIERDLTEGALTESQAQELVDQFVMKLRMVRFARTPDYDNLFSGDPTWVTESIGGIGEDGRPLVTKTSFRFLHTLYNLGPAPEPNLTVLWSERLPAAFKRFCARVSIDKSSIQYENDDLMRHSFGDDYAIACCVSAARVGQQMQFFGARANLAKCLLYALNGGRDEISGDQVGPELAPVTGDYLEFNDVMRRLDLMMDWLAAIYVKTLNVIHYMHDKYCFERIEMALHDTDPQRFLATGIAGLSVVADSLSAIRYSRVKVIRDGRGLIVDFVRESEEFPKYGNSDDRVDQLAVDVVKSFSTKLRKQKVYRDAEPTLSVLTITSNIVYGKLTGNTPDGRRAGEPFAPGANPMHGRDHLGAVASMASVSRIPYRYARDGISYTFSILPKALGTASEIREKNLCGLLDGYFRDGGHHINVNVLDRETLIRAMEHPEEFPQLTVRVSGYAVNFIRLNREQQLEVLKRTFHESLGPAGTARA